MQKSCPKSQPYMTLQIADQAPAGTKKSNIYLSLTNYMVSLSLICLETLSTRPISAIKNISDVPP